MFLDQNGKKMMNKRRIFITEFDKTRLDELIAVADEFGNHRRNDLQALASELQRADIVSPADVPPDLVTMNSQIVVYDMDTREKMTYRLVFPSDANIDEGSISVLAPIGTAILGYSKGDVVEWPVPAGMRRIRIEKIIYQPEAAGDEC